MANKACQCSTIFRLIVVLCALISLATYQLGGFHLASSTTVFGVRLLNTTASAMIGAPSGKPSKSESLSVKHNAASNSDYKSLIDLIDGLKPIFSADNIREMNRNLTCRYSSRHRTSQQSTSHCVPLSLADLNSTCAKPLDRERLHCGFGFAPSTCAASSSSSTPSTCLAIIVPYRNRLTNLLLLAHHLHNLFQHQSISYGIYVVEQNDTKRFNRAKLLNIGFALSQKHHPCDCFIFHDADKLPESPIADYSCQADAPRHLIGQLYNLASKKYSPGRVYHQFFGGIVALTKRQFESVNGNSNQYFGWGREDDELSARLRIKHWRIAYANRRAKFVNLNHADDINVNSMPWPAMGLVKKRMLTDGLSSLQYNLTGVYCHPLFTVFSVQV